MESSEDNHRHEKRVGYHFVLRARPLNPATPKAAWDVSTVRNISKTGVLFYSSNKYTPGADIEIKITNPLILEEITCAGIVVRCDPVEKMENIYSVAVEIRKVDEISREVFDKTIDFFIKRKQ